jgi:monovalent cation/proton antiporter MnhG/PhaG subunit
MTLWLSSLFLVGGAALCLLAAAGVLRLPDFFMRMHAATKAGVVGCGLMLLGVGLADGTTGTWAKIAIALAFLLLTTPVAGHLLGRAAYVGGAPLWEGTAGDALNRVLPRGRFDSSTGPARPPTIGTEGCRTVILALAQGPQMKAAVEQAIRLAREHDAELCGAAIIDVPRLCNVGPVPIGGGWHAQQMRERRIRLARQAAADVIQQFERMAAHSGLRWAVRLEEGRPSRVLSALATPDSMLAVAPGGWFDQGVLELKVDVQRRLRWSGLRRDIVVLGAATDNFAS